MKKMKTTIAATVALAACAGTQLFAQPVQNVKIDNITMALTVMQQLSVSTSATANNAGKFSQGPKFYKTQTYKLTDKDLIKAIGFVMHGTPSFYSTRAVLQLVQGELGGFWNVTDPVAQSYADIDSNNFLPGTFNDEGDDINFYDTGSSGYGSANDGVAADFPIIFPDIGPANDYTGVLDSSDNNFEDFATFLFLGSRIDIADGISSNPDQGGAYARLDTGRHFLPVPWLDDTTSPETPYPTTGQYPVGHMQPWGQIFIKDPGANNSAAADPLCDNVTFFFCLTVEECYDCFYLSSFITDARFSTKTTNPGQSGPPCCSVPSSTLLLGSGTDKYYMTLSFDNTQANPFLNPSTEVIDNGDDDTVYFYNYVGVTGIRASVGVADGVSPDLLKYSDPILSGLGSPSPYEVRFSLNGIVTYKWNLQLLNSSDLAADFVGTATFNANGYGFIHLICTLLTGTATFSEKVVKDTGCCDDYSWYESWYGPGSDFGPTGTYHGPVEGFGYFNPQQDQINTFPYFNVVGGETYDTNTLASNLPDQFESPYNPGAALANHHVFHCCGSKDGQFVEPSVQ